MNAIFVVARATIGSELRCVIEGDIEPTYWFPNDELKYSNGTYFLKKRDANSIDNLFTKRSLAILSFFWKKITDYQTSESVKNCLKIIFLASLQRCSKMCRNSGGT